MLSQTIVWRIMVFATQFTAAYVIVNALCLVLSMIIMGAVSRNLGTQDQNRHFRLVLIAFMVFNVFDAVWALIACSGLFSPGELALSVVNGINQMALACCGCFWIHFILSFMSGEIPNRKAVTTASVVPAALVPILHAIGYVLDQNVVVHPDGTMTYGWMHTATVCMILSYGIMSTCILACEYRRAHSSAQRSLCLAFMTFMLPFIVGGIVDTLIPSTPIAAACIAASLTFVMVSMQESRISSDALTGLNNRHRADAYLETSMTRVTPERPIHLFMIDLDGFKGINDTFGHLEGDRALCLVADALRGACSKLSSFVARWGGDEFMLICTNLTNDDEDYVPGVIRDELAQRAAKADLPYQLSCSVGHASCDSPDEDCDRLVARADEMLYRVKRAKNVGR